MDAQLVSNKCDLKFLCTFYCEVKTRLEHERDYILNLCFGRKIRCLNNVLIFP